jgi:streptococcal pilin isopeptide linkage domain
MKRKSVFWLTVFCMILCILMSDGVRTSAASYQSCWVDIPFSVEDVSNKIPQDTSFEVEIKAHGKAPLPEISTIETEVRGDYAIERITFDQPGTYSYTVSIRKKEGADSNVHADDSVYDLKVFVFARDDGSLYSTVAVYQNDSQLKSDNASGTEEGVSMIAFRNSYGTDTNGTVSSQNGDGNSSPGTGEPDWLLPAYGALLVSGLLVLSLFARPVCRRLKDQEGD